MNKHPKLCRTASFIYDREFGEMICTDSETDAFMIIDNEGYKLLSLLDGKTDPYSLDTELINLSPEERSEVIKEAGEKGLISKGMIKRAGFLTFIMTLLVFRNKNEGISPTRIICFFLNMFLYISFIPVFVFGLLLNLRFAATGAADLFDFTISGYLAGVTIGIVLHEISHAVSCYGYGGQIYSAGLLLKVFLPGAYVNIDTSSIKTYRRKAQTFAAGVESNFFISGLFFILGCLLGRAESFFSTVAYVNMLLGIFNLMLWPGLDGEKILSALFNGAAFISDPLSEIRAKSKGFYSKLIKIASCFLLAVKSSYYLYSLILTAEVICIVFLII